MGLGEGLTVLGVLAFFVYIIMAKMNQKNPVFIRKVKAWFAEKEIKKPELLEMDEFSRQTYQEKRTIM